MATFNDRATIDRLISNNGHYELNWRDDPFADPPIMRITEYTNQWGNVAWGVVWPHDDIEKYATSSFVQQPRIIFEHEAHADCNDPEGRE